MSGRRAAQRRCAAAELLYTVSPLALSWDDENYYLIAFDASENKIKHYRVDKMQDIRCTGRSRKLPGGFSDFDAAQYTKKGIRHVRRERAECDPVLRQSACGRGYRPLREGYYDGSGEDTFTFTASVQVSPQFFAWLCGLGDKIKIQAPRDVKDEFIEYIQKIKR